jgi:hypothetical protein
MKKDSNGNEEETTFSEYYLSVHNLKTTEMNQPLLVIKQKKVNIQSVM